MILKAVQKPSKGFSLTELAIVLGVIGFVLAAIWTAGGSVHKRQQVEDTITTLTDIATRVRGFVSGNPKMVPSTTLSVQIATGLFPDAAVNAAKTDTVNVWGGNIRLAYKRNTTIVSGFTIAFSLPKAASANDRDAICLDILSKFPANGSTINASISAPAGDPPVPTGSVVAEPQQGHEPLYVYLKGGSWINETNQPIGTVTSNLGSNGCEGIAYYFAL